MESRRGSGRSLVSEVVSTFVYKAWILRSESKRISQSELAKRPDPFFLLDLLDWKLLNGSVSVDLPQKSVTLCIFYVVKTEDCSGSDASPERYNEEDSSSKTPTDDDNETHLNGVDEEEEAELWRQMAFAQESSKVGNGGECTRQRSQTNRRLLPCLLTHQNTHRKHHRSCLLQEELTHANKKKKQKQRGWTSQKPTLLLTPTTSKETRCSSIQGTTTR
ncbi:BnaCnng55260D [Brassica napus]|uniref:BnaCnng55260D protein n=1 Tax=Brassica napus TaxID=3708 RepID=A0A078JM26_BRANA|nr:BnaCnng55260D [Brassica napus]